MSETQQTATEWTEITDAFSNRRRRTGCQSPHRPAALIGSPLCSARVLRKKKQVIALCNENFKKDPFFCLTVLDPKVCHLSCMSMESMARF